MMGTLRSNEDEKSFLHELIGYKLLEFRTGCLTYFKTRQQQSPLILQKKKWKELILLANQKNRKYIRTYTNDKSRSNSNKKENRGYLPKVSGEMSNVKGKQCSVCGSSTLTEDEATFHRIPFVHMAPIGSTDNDNRRKKLAIHQHRRLLYLQRFNILSKKEKKYIYYCNKHKLVSERFTIDWKNQNGEMERTSTYLVVPEPPIQTINNQTRSQTKNVRCRFPQC